MPEQLAPGASVEDLHGDKLNLYPRDWANDRGVSLVLESPDPETDTLVYDLPRTIELRDALTNIIDAQQETPHDRH